MKKKPGKVCIFHTIKKSNSSISLQTSPVIIKPDGSTSTTRDQTDSSWTKWVIPLVIAVAAVVLFKLLVKPGPDINRPPRAI